MSTSRPEARRRPPRGPGDPGGGEAYDLVTRRAGCAARQPPETGQETAASQDRVRFAPDPSTPLRAPRRLAYAGPPAAEKRPGNNPRARGGLTFRNTDIALFAGDKEVMGAVALTVRNCRFEDVGVGVWTENADSRDFFISDNLFLGREDQMRLIGWNQAGSRAAGIYQSHQPRSFFAIKVYGPGHVIAHNAIAYFHDGICISTYGTPDSDPERR